MITRNSIITVSQMNARGHSLKNEPEVAFVCKGNGLLIVGSVDDGMAYVYLRAF
jgi:hypothetical protein